MQNISPIALFTYNRFDHTRRTIEQLQKNKLAAQSELFVFSDGPRNTSDADKVTEVRQYLKTIDGFAQVTIVEQAKNLGLANSIINGVTQMVNRYGRVIVLEDDLLTSPFFLTYMNRALEIYEDQEKVISIHGYTPPIKEALPDTFFLRNADCWGWATWKRGWALFEPDGEKLLAKLKSKRLTRQFDYDGRICYTKMLRDQILGRNDSWAVRWYASAFLLDKLTLHPGRSLVHNIGSDGSGSHHADSNFMDVEIADFISLYEIPCYENESAWQAMKNFYTSKRKKTALKYLDKLFKILK